MHYKSILSAFVASSLVTAAPVPEDAIARTAGANFVVCPTQFQPECRPEFLLSLPVDTSLFVPPTGNTSLFVPLPEYQSTNPGHTWPLIQCIPRYKDQNLPKHSKCMKDLPSPYGYPEIAILTWNTDIIKIDERCNDRWDLPPSWVCMKPDGTNYLNGAESHLQRGFWKPMDCYKHYDHEPCHFSKKGIKEVIDENRVEWDEARNEDGGQGW